MKKKCAAWLAGHLGVERKTCHATRSKRVGGRERQIKGRKAEAKRPLRFFFYGSTFPHLPSTVARLSVFKVLLLYYYFNSVGLGGGLGRKKEKEKIKKYENKKAFRC